VRTFKSLNEQEILALAISLEEEDARIACWICIASVSAITFR
jgi:hypothetical protein